MTLGPALLTAHVVRGKEKGWELGWDEGRGEHHLCVCATTQQTQQTQRTQWTRDQLSHAHALSAGSPEPGPAAQVRSAAAGESWGKLSRVPQPVRGKGQLCTFGQLQIPKGSQAAA